LIDAVGSGVLEPRKAVAVAKAILWNPLNLRDTYSRRCEMQANRKANEKAVLTSMYPKIRRYQPAEHTTLRGILDMFFEYSQSVPDRLNYIGSSKGYCMLKACGSRR
jgi:hypothetical protein